MIILKAPFPLYTKTVILRSPELDNTNEIQPEVIIKVSMSGSLRSYIRRKAALNFNFTFNELKYEDVWHFEHFIREFLGELILLTRWDNVQLLGSIDSDPLTITYPVTGENGSVSFNFIGREV